MNKLCPARIDDCRLPLGFGQMHVDDLRSWDGELNHPGLESLLRALEQRTGKKARLGARPRTESDEERVQELEAFKAAEILGTGDALRAFLRQYPKGAFAGFVRGQLETMPAQKETVMAGGGGGAPPPPRDVPPSNFAGGGGYSPASSAPRPEPRREPIVSGGDDVVTKVKKLPLPAIIAGVGALLLVIFGISQLMKPSSSGDLTGDGSAYSHGALGDQVRQAADNARAAALQAEAAAQSARDGVAGYQTVTYGSNRYEGGWSNGEKAGYGKFYYPNGDYHAGGYAGGVRSGPGVFYFADGRRYVGEFLNDTYNGYGVLYTSKGDVRQQGAWADGKFLGESATPAARGDSGKFALSALDGDVRDAAERARNGVKKAQDAAARARNGETGTRVVQLNPSGLYEGEVDANGGLHGYGVLTWPNGDRHAGLYGNGVRNGPGTFFFNDGSRYEGEWLADKYGGLGVLFNADGSLKSEGRWSENSLVLPMGPQGN
jgi:hypothetical protein